MTSPKMDLERKKLLSDVLLAEWCRDHGAGEGIKIRVSWPVAGLSAETLWARREGPGRARVHNVPFLTDAFSLGDLVEIDDDNEVVRVLERVARTRHATYPTEGSDAEVRQRYAGLKRYLGRFGIRAEGGVPGLLGLAVPLGLGDPELAAICSGCGEPLDLIPAEGDDSVASDHREEDKDTPTTAGAIDEDVGRDAGSTPATPDNLADATSSVLVHAAG